jgi:hypothetical protein
MHLNRSAHIVRQPANLPSFQLVESRGPSKDPVTILVDPFSTDDVGKRDDGPQAMHFGSRAPLVVLVLEEVMVAEDVLKVPDSTFEEAVRRHPTDFASETVAVASPVGMDHFHY